MREETEVNPRVSSSRVILIVARVFIFAHVARSFVSPCTASVECSLMEIRPRESATAPWSHGPFFTSK